MNRYDFAYAGKDTVNQAFKNLDKSAPALIQNLSGELNNILEQGIHQVITEGGEQLKQLGPQLRKRTKHCLSCWGNLKSQNLQRLNNN